MNKEKKKYHSQYADAIETEADDAKTMKAYEWFKKPSYYQTEEKRKCKDKTK